MGTHFTRRVPDQVRILIESVSAANAARRHMPVRNGTALLAYLETFHFHKDLARPALAGGQMFGLLRRIHDRTY